MNMSSCVWPMRGVITEVGGVMGVMAGDGPSDSKTSLSGLSNDTSSVASIHTHTHTHHHFSTELLGINCFMGSKMSSMFFLLLLF